MSFQFNETFYLTQNIDVHAAVQAGMFASGLAHYNAYGWVEGRDPNPHFDTSYYVSQNQDVADAVFAGLFESPLEHFLLHGAAEGRAPSEAAAELLAYWDEAAYLAANLDVADAIAAGAFDSGQEHWMLHGQFENRPGGPELPPVDADFTLTTGTDTITGGDGDDTFKAEAFQTPLMPNQTLNHTDNINGGGGRNTLNVQLVDPYVIPAGLWNIHEVNISGPGGILPMLLPAPTLDVLNADSIDTINFRNSIQSITVNNLATALDSVSISDEFVNLPWVPAVAHTINHVGAATDGTDDKLTIDLRNATLSTLTLNHASLDPNAGYEVFDINSTGTVANFFTLVNGTGGPRDVTIQGNNALTLNGISFNTLRTLDAQGLLAPFTATFAGGNSANEDVTITGSTFANTLTFAGNTTGTGLLTVTTFGGNDTLTVHTHTGDVTIDGGDGNNVFNIGGLGTTTPLRGPAALLGNVVGDISLTGGDGNDTFNFYQVNNATNFNAGDSVDGGDGGNNVLSFDVFNPAFVVPVDLLVADTTIANIQTIRVTGDLFGDFGGILNVDWANSGSANRLELAANALGTVTVTNLDFADGDTVAVYPIANTGIGTVLNLTLVRAISTAPAFNLELNDGVIVHNLNVGGGSDLLNLTSLNPSGPVNALNRIIDASNINAGEIYITGDTDLQIGTSLANGFDQTGAVINAADFGANLWLWTAEGNQIIHDGDGDDVYILSLNSGANTDVLNLGEGSDTVLIQAANTAGNGGGLTNNSVHHVNGFSTSGDGADILAISVSGAGIATLDDASGNPVGGGTIDANWNIINSDDVIIRNVEVGDSINLIGTAVNVLKFVTAVTGATSIENLFELALGTFGTVTTSVGGSNILASAYDLDAEQAVFFVIDGPGPNISGGPGVTDIDGLATLSMSYDDYLAFDASNLAFLA